MCHHSPPCQYKYQYLPVALLRARGPLVSRFAPGLILFVGDVAALGASQVVVVVSPKSLQHPLVFREVSLQYKML